MSNQLAHYTAGELTEADIHTVKETIARECNESQFKLFLSICQQSGANPIIGEIHPSVFKGKLTVQFGIDFYVRKAKESEGYAGHDVQLVHENDEFKMHQERAEDGRYYAVIDNHTWSFPRGRVIGGYAMAYKEGNPPFTVTMEVDEVEHFKKSQIGMQKTMWTNYFNDMFKKHMLKRALKAAFGLRFDDSDIENKATNDVPEYQPQPRKDITPHQEQLQEPTTQQSQQENIVNEEQVRNEIKVKFEQLGITDGKEMGEYIQKHAKPKGDKPTLQELIGLSNIMDMHIEMKQNQQNDELPV